MSFASEPGRDDGGLPPVNIIIPDDARELDRDVLAYRRELRARRRRELLKRLLRPLRGLGPNGHGTVLPLVATVVALSMLAGAMLSVVAISPASAPTVTGPALSGPGSTGASGARAGAANSPSPGPLPVGLTVLPAGAVTIGGQEMPVRGLVSAALALIPANCGCGSALLRLASQAAAARVGVYFVGEGAAISQVPTLTARYGKDIAVSAADPGSVLSAAFRPVGLTVLLVYSDATAQVRRNLPADFQLGPTLRTLTLAGRESAS